MKCAGDVVKANAPCVSSQRYLQPPLPVLVLGKIHYYSNKTAHMTQNNFVNFSIGAGNPSPSPVANSMVGTSCTSDFLQIPQGTTSTIALATRSTTSAATSLAAEFNRFCGRFFNIASTKTTSTTICTGVVPFRIRFVTNEDESTTGTTSNTNELVLNPEGTIGFSLTYVQTDCT